MVSGPQYQKIGALVWRKDRKKKVKSFSNDLNEQIGDATIESKGTVVAREENSSSWCWSKMVAAGEIAMSG